MQQSSIMKRPAEDHQIRWSKKAKAYQMLEWLAYKVNIPSKDIMWGGKADHLVRARWALMWALCTEYQWIPNKIARLFEMDHTTVLHGLQKAGHLRMSDDGFRALVDEMIEANRA